MNAIGEAAVRDLRFTVARHLQPSAKSIRISGSDTSTNFSMNDNLCSILKGGMVSRFKIDTENGLYTYKNDTCDTE